MTRFQKQELTEMVLYILNATKGTDIYHVFKILYFAEQKHLLKWGASMVHDDFRAYQYGPVPAQLYKALRHGRKYGSELPDMVMEAISFAGVDAPNILLPKRKPNMEWLSRADVECLDEAIHENANLSFEQLKEKSHDDAWQEAFNGMDDRMNIVSIAKAAGANEGLLEYIEEQMAIDLALA